MPEKRHEQGWYSKPALSSARLDPYSARPCNLALANTFAKQLPTPTKAILTAGTRVTRRLTGLNNQKLAPYNHQYASWVKVCVGCVLIESGQVNFTFVEKQSFSLEHYLYQVILRLRVEQSRCCAICTFCAKRNSCVEVSGGYEPEFCPPR